jgi:uncharacterized lipoprotein YmbA
VPTTAPEFKVPESLATCADLLYTTREARLLIEKQAEALKSRETQLREHLIANLPKSEATGVAGQVARATIVTKIEPAVEDWDAFYKYVARTKSWDMLQRRISAPAIRARWEAKKVVGGVGTVTVTSVSLNKVK